MIVAFQAHSLHCGDPPGVDDQVTKSECGKHAVHAISQDAEDGWKALFAFASLFLRKSATADVTQSPS